MLKVALISCLFMLSCSSSKNPSQQNSVDLNFRYKVSFVSIGEGIDQEALTNFKFFISDFEKQNKVKLMPTIITWGREGELDYCFTLVNLPKNKQVYFIDESKEILRTSTLVRFDENCPCKPI